MARIRSVKPGFFTSLDIAELNPRTRLHFIGLWTYADDAGRGIDNPRLVKAAIWPLDDVTAEDIDQMHDELAKHGRIVRYSDARRSYFEVVNWTAHQRPNRPLPSGLPGPDDPSVIPHASLSESALTAHPSENEECSQEGLGEEGLGGENPLSTDVDTHTDDGFAAFWDVWPPRNGKKLAKAKAQRAWARLTLPQRRDAYSGALHYAAASNTGLAGAKDAFRWLQGHEWTDWQTPANPGATNGHIHAAQDPRVGEPLPDGTFRGIV